MRRGGRRATRKDPGNQVNLPDRQNQGSAIPHAESPNFAANLGSNAAKNAPNIVSVQVSNGLNGRNQNLELQNEVSVNMIPAQIPMNSAGIITPSRMVTQESQRQQNQGEVFHNNSGIPQLPSVNPSLSMGSMSLLTNIGTINSFKGNTTENIQEWLTQFNWVADINKWSEDIRCALLPGYLDDVAKIWYSTLSMRDRGNYQIIQNKLLQAFQQVISPVQHLNQFLLRTQSEQESVETYAYNKLKLCENLNKEMAETDKITYLIQGMKSQLRSYLLERNHHQWHKLYS